MIISDVYNVRDAVLIVVVTDNSNVVVVVHVGFSLLLETQLLLMNYSYTDVAVS